MSVRYHPEGCVNRRHNASAESASPQSVNSTRVADHACCLASEAAPHRGSRLDAIRYSLAVGLAWAGIAIGIAFVGAACAIIPAESPKRRR